MHAVFFCLKGAYRESKFVPIAGRLTKIKPNAIFNDFAISHDRTKIAEVGAE